MSFNALWYLASSCVIAVASESSAVAYMERLRISVGVRHPKSDFESVVNARSHPEHGLYLKHLSRGDVETYVADKVSQTAVQKWLEKLGAQNVILHEPGDVFTAEVPDYRSLNTLKSRVGWPAEIDELVDFVYLPDTQNAPTLSAAAQLKRAIRMKSMLAAIGTPKVQRITYNVPSDIDATGARVMVWGVGTFGFRQEDLWLYLNLFSGAANTTAVREQIEKITYIGHSVNSSGDNFGEGTLDTQIIAGLSFGANISVVNTNRSLTTDESDGFGTAFLHFLSMLNTQEELPHVLSLSLGSMSAASCDRMCSELMRETEFSYDTCMTDLKEQSQVCMFQSERQQMRIHQELLKLGARGVTVVSATGDGGSHFSFTPFAEDTRIGRALNNISCRSNFPTFAPTSSAVLAVGGTDFPNGVPNEHTPPQSWAQGGGGFSLQFPRPSWQTKAVDEYLANFRNVMPPVASFNARGRAYPDVAALATNVPMCVNNECFLVGGTSAAAPTVAALLTLITAERINAGLPPLGMIAPRLYRIWESDRTVFDDIVDGPTSQVECANGFPSTTGWDARTGLGHVNYRKLVKKLLTDPVDLSVRDTPEEKAFQEGFLRGKVE